MKFFKFTIILALSGLTHFANAQVVAGANMSYGTGLMAGQQGNCPTGVQPSPAVFKGNDQTRELQRQAKQAVAIYKTKQSALKRAELNVKRAEGQIGLFFAAGALATIKTHVQGETISDGDSESTQRLACSAYFTDTSKTVVGGDEGDGSSTETRTAEYQHDPFSENEWKRACPSNRSNSTLSSELCKMPNHMRSTAAGKNVGGCSKALNDYQKQTAQFEDLKLEVAALESQLELVNDQYNLEMEIGASEFAANGGRDATEGGVCVECERKKRGGIGTWLNQNLGNIAQIMLGVGKSLIVKNEISNIADYNASVGYPTESMTGLAVLAGAGDVVNGTMGIISNGSATPGGTHGSFACGGSPAWTNGNGYANGNAYGNANQWAFGNPMANAGVNLNGQFNNGFGLGNTNSQFNVNPLLAMNGMGGIGSGYASTSPFNMGGNGQVGLGGNGLLNAFLSGGRFAGGAGGVQPSIFAQYSNGGIPNAGVGNGTYYGNPNGILGNGQFGGQAGGYGAGGTLGALLGAFNGGNGNMGGLFPGQMGGQFGGQFGGQAGGQQVCIATGCYMVNGGAQAYGQFPSTGMDSATLQMQLQQQQAALAQQQAQLQASFQAEQQRLANQAIWAQQRQAAEIEFKTAYQKLMSVDQTGGQYLSNTGYGQMGGAGGYVSMGAAFGGLSQMGGYQQPTGSFVGGQFGQPGQFGATGQFGSAGQFGGVGQFGGGAGVVGAPTYNSVLPGLPGANGVDTGARPGR